MPRARSDPSKDRSARDHATVSSPSVGAVRIDVKRDSPPSATGLLRRGRDAAGYRDLALLAAAAGGALGAALAGRIGRTAAASAIAVVMTLKVTGVLASRDPFHPALVVAVFLGVLTIGRAAYVLDQDAFGLATHLRVPVEGHERTFAVAVLAQLGGAVLFAAGAWLARPRPRPPAPRADAARRPPRQRPLLVALGIVSVLSIACLVQLLREAGGVAGYVRALDHRQVFFDEHGWLVTIPAILPSLVLAWWALNVRSLRTRRDWALGGGLVALACVMAAATGVRSTLLFLFLVPLLAIVHLRVRRIGLGAAIVAGAIVFLLGAAYREAVHDQDNPDAARLYAEGPKGLVVNTFASADAHLPDAVATLMLVRPDRKWGSTIANAAVTPVPRRLWNGKPRGANQQFTTMIAPRWYARTKAEYGVTLGGELFWNFWWVGLLGFAAVGYASGVAYRRAIARPDDPLRVLLFAAVIGTLLLLLRADAWNTTIGSVQAFGPGLALVGLATRRPA
jgi:hypothetical protein